MGKKCFGFCFFLLFLIIFASEEMMVATAKKPRVCESKSHNFRGPCVSDGNCGQVCRNEGFTGGKCRGFRHRCFCTKPC